MSCPFEHRPAPPPPPPPPPRTSVSLPPRGRAGRVRRSFRTFDTSGEGTLTVTGLAAIYSDPRGSMPYSPEEALAEARSVMAAFSKKQDGFLRYEDYIAWWHSATSEVPASPSVLAHPQSYVLEAPSPRPAVTRVRDSDEATIFSVGVGAVGELTISAAGSSEALLFCRPLGPSAYLLVKAGTTIATVHKTAHTESNRRSVVYTVHRAPPGPPPRRRPPAAQTPRRRRCNRRALSLRTALLPHRGLGARIHTRRAMPNSTPPDARRRRCYTQSTPRRSWST